MPSVKFLISNGGYNAGEMASFDDEFVEELVEKGIAEIVIPEKPKAAEKPKPKKVDF